MEEETSLKNHLHWACIKVKGDGKKVPRELKISNVSFTYKIPIWRDRRLSVCGENGERKMFMYHWTKGLYSLCL